MYNFHNVSKDTEQLLKFTGLEIEKCHHLYEVVSPGPKCDHMKFYDPSSVAKADRRPSVIDKSKPGP